MIIVSGIENSGTRVVVWLLQSLGVDMGSDLYPEMSWVLMDKFVNSVVNVSAKRKYLEEKNNEVLKENVLRILDAHSKKKKLWGFKSTQLIYILPNIFKILEEEGIDFKFIHSIRDGRDIREKYMKRAIGHCELMNPDLLNGIEKKDIYEKFLHIWSELNLFLSNDIKNKLGSRYFRISLEDIVDPDTIKREIISLSKFIGKNGLFDEKIFYKITIPRSVGRHIFENRTSPLWIQPVLNRFGFNYNVMERFNGK